MDMKQRTDDYYKGFIDGKNLMQEKAREIKDKLMKKMTCPYLTPHCTTDCTDCLLNSHDIEDAFNEIFGI